MCNDGWLCMYLRPILSLSLSLSPSLSLQPLCVCACFFFFWSTIFVVHVAQDLECVVFLFPPSPFLGTYTLSPFQTPIVSLSLAVTALMVLCAVQMVFAAPSATFSEKDAKHMAAAVLAEQRASSTFGGAENTFFAVSSLKRLGKSVPKSKKLCSRLESGVERMSDDIVSLYHIVASSALLGCPVKITDEAAKTISESVQDSLLESVYYGVAAAEQIAANGGASATASGVKPERIVEFVSSVVGSSGLASSKAGAGDSSVENTVLAARLLARASALGAEVSASLVSRIGKVVNSGSRHLKALYFKGNADVSSVSLTTAVAEALLSIGAAKPDTISELATFTIRSKSSRSIPDIFNVLAALDRFSDNPVGIPVAVMMKGDDIKVTNLLGESAGALTVTLDGAEDENGERVLGKKELTAVKGSNTYAVSGLPSGFSKLTISVDPEGANSRVLPSKSVRWFKKSGSPPEKITASITVGETITNDMPFPKRISRVLSADNEAFVVSVNVGKAKPSQTFVQLKNKENGETATFIVKKGAAKIDLNSARAQRMIGTDGEYDIYVIVGDARYAGVNWNFATIKITLPVAESTTKGDEQQMYSTPFEINPPKAGLPEMEHTFSPPARRPFALLSLIFAFIVPAPMVIFFLYVPIAIGLNLRFPSGSGFVWTLLFQGSIALLLLNIVRYWIGTTIFNAATALAVIAIGVTFTGNRALTAHGAMEDELENENKAKKSSASEKKD